MKNLVENVIKFMDRAGDQYENMTPEHQAKVREVLLKRKHVLESMDLSNLTNALQEIFGEHYTLPENWWLYYPHLEGLNADDDYFVEHMTTKCIRGDQTNFGWIEACSILDPDVAKDKAEVLLDDIRSHSDEIEYIKRNIDCAVTYWKGDKNEALEKVKEYGNYVIEQISLYLFSCICYPADYFDRWEDTENSAKSYITNADYDGLWDEEAAKAETGFEVDRERI